MPRQSQTMEVKIKLSIDRIDRASQMLKAIAHPIRLSILDILESGGKYCVSEIHEALNIEQAVASQHLKILKDKDVIDSEKDGKHCYYFLKHKALGKIVECVQSCE